MVSLLLLALAFASVLVVIESVWLLAGGDEPVGPIDYEGLWDAVTGWRPEEWAQIAAYCSAIVIGLALVLMQFLPRRRDHTVEIARSENGVVVLDDRTIAPLLADRLRAQEWVRNARPSVKLDGTTASVSSRPSTVRPWEEGEVTDVTSTVRAELERLGLEAGDIGIDPRDPSGRRAARVR